eukprot:jgi/Orpsp1_1/1176407/evm.model.c7180000057489.1
MDLINNDQESEDKLDDCSIVSSSDYNLINNNLKGNSNYSSIEFNINRSVFGHLKNNYNNILSIEDIPEMNYQNMEQQNDRELINPFEDDGDIIIPTKSKCDENKNNDNNKNEISSNKNIIDENIKSLDDSIDKKNNTKLSDNNNIH